MFGATYAIAKISYIRGASAGSTFAGDAFFAQVACIRDIFTKDARIEDARIGDIGAASARDTGDVVTLKGLSIHLRWSRILEVRLFNTEL